MILAAVGVLNRFEVARECLEALAANSTDDCLMVAIDNGSDSPLHEQRWLPVGVRVKVNPENTGNWALFGEALHLRDLFDPTQRLGHLTAIAVLHSDLIVWEKGWDRRVEAAFLADERLGLLGFVGAKEIVPGGGRRIVMVNFQGIRGTHARDHGFQLPTLEPAACVDGCAMVFRPEFLRGAWDPDWPPHHFYDKELSCRALASGWRVAFLGVACDHLGGETVNREPKYHELARRWCLERGVAPHPDTPENWDRAVYLEAQRRFVRRWEQEQSFLPVNVAGDWSVRHER